MLELHGPHGLHPCACHLETVAGLEKNPVVVTDPARHQAVAAAIEHHPTAQGKGVCNVVLDLAAGEAEATS